MKNILVITMILFFLMTWVSIEIINRGIKPALMEAAEVKTTEFATRAINSAVRFAEDYNFEDITRMETEGDVTIVGWNSSVVSEINRVSTDKVEEFFKYMNRGMLPPTSDSESSDQVPGNYSNSTDNLSEKDPTVIEIPIGQATGNTILANLGPKVPVNLQLAGAVRTNIVHVEESVGINNVVITLWLEIEADVQIIVPFTSDVTTVDTEIYIDKKLIMGDVPEFYGGSGNGGIDIAIPKKDLKKGE
ncbi:sporulation protein YunB [Virgibacillus oceani]|uniref:sporulation protein YunB n=1 Tax=Virgibacillus oceani TaxID=1479511 RepID=UPI001E2EB950|nr:sporulation protein YunB [Virgibacillus oceani]